MKFYPAIKRLLPNCRLIAALLALSAAGAAPAATFCVTNSASLQAVLTVAQSNGQANIIQVAAGTYLAPNGGFVYNAAAGGNDNHLTIIGGWTEHLGHPCGQRSETDPLKTVLDGNDTTRVMWITAGRNSDVTVRGLTFARGAFWNGAGLRVDDTQAGYASTITIEGNAFTANTANNHGGGLVVDIRAQDNDSALLRTVNNVFLENHAGNGLGGGANLNVRGGAGMVLTNNTLVHNTAAPSISGHVNGGIYVITGHQYSASKVIANNNFWSNGGSDLFIGDSGQVHLLHNNFSTRSGFPPTLNLGNINVEPEYEPCSTCPAWIPVLSSPLVDGGIHPDPSASWYLTDYDLLSQARVNGGRVDIGAYENHDRLFSDRFEAK